MDNFLKEIFAKSTERAKYRFWMISDLQQGEPRWAEAYMTTAMDDMNEMQVEKLSGICYLGDAAEGRDPDKIRIMLDMQIGQLESLNVPIYYVMGNHEFDYYHLLNSENKQPVIPFYEAVKGRKLWHVVPDQETFWFTHETEDFIFLFFSDHASKDGSWCATHQFLPPPEQPYPHTKEVWQAVRDKFADCGKPVFTFAHCAFPGGNRPSQYLEQLLPLPDNFRAHFHGHSHIGDGAWGGKDLYRQVACVDDHPQMQFDISSLDHMRGTAVRSAFFDYYGDGQYGVFFRDHTNRRWELCNISTHDAKSSDIPDRYKK